MEKPKHIIGSVVRGTKDQGLGIRFSFAKDKGYDEMASITEIGSPSSKETFEIFYSRQSISITYKNTKAVGQKTFRIYFKSGDEEEITIMLPPLKRGLPDNDLIQLLPGFVNGGESLFASRTELVTAQDKSFPEAQVAVMAHSDPDNAFGFEKVWRSGGGRTFAVHDSTNIRKLWAKNGFDGGVPSSETNQIQHATFMHVLDNVNEYASGAELFMSALENEGLTVFSFFTWSKGVLSQTKEGNKRVFDVCTESSSPSYFRTTGLDSAGSTIPQDYLDGKYPVIWSEGTCAVNSIPFQTYLKIDTDDGAQVVVEAIVYSNAASPAKTQLDSNTSEEIYKRPIYPPLNDSTFSYNLIVPPGVTYGGTTTFNGVNHTNIKWTDLPHAERPYVIEIVDDATQTKDRIPFVVPEILDKRQTCVCNVEGSLNYQAPAGDPADLDPCGICLSCAEGYITVDGVQTGDNLILNTNSTTNNPSINGASDGSIVFNGIVNNTFGGGTYPNIFSFLNGEFNMYLYEVVGPTGNPTDPAIQDGNSVSSPNYTFDNLPAGHYVIQIFSKGDLCVSSYRFELTEEEVTPEVCNPNLVFAINPCSGQSSLNIANSANNSITETIFTLNGTVVPAPPVVGAGDQFVVRINYTNPECIDYYEEFDVTAEMLECEEVLPPTEIGGCTDPAAVNFSVVPTFNDGSCFYGVPGCTDITAANYDPTATIENGTCIYGITGCTNPLSPNFDPLANVDSGLCLPECDATYILAISLTGSGVPSIIFVGAAPASYSLLYTNTTTGETVVVTYGDTPPSLDNGVWNVVLTTLEGCTDMFWFGKTKGIVFGCMDKNASNHDLTANIPAEYYDVVRYPADTYTGVCEYRIKPSPCIPTEINVIENNINACLSSLTSKFLTNLKSGRVTDCNDNSTRLLSLIKYLFSRKGLECLYNCADSLTPEIGSLAPGLSTCKDQWILGGSLVWNQSSAYSTGQMVLFEDNYYTWIDTASSPPSKNVVGSDSWSLCPEPTETIGVEGGINRIDSYIAWIEKICKDCGLPGAAAPRVPVETISISSGATMQGSAISINNDEPIF